jgi:hypothetical protein
MAIKDIPEDTDGRVLNSLSGQRNRGQTTRMSIDLTREEQKEFLMEAVDHNMTLRGYFYHCWRNSQKAEGIASAPRAHVADPDNLADATVKKHLKTSA